MANTSDNHDGVDYANELVTPFFTRAQIFAFSKAPSPEALKKVNRGGSHDYIPHEYIRALLDRYIGPSRWSIQATLQSTDKEIVTKKGVEQIAATAIVNVTLTIFAKEDPNLKLVYGGVGSHTMYANLEAGYGSVIGNAIDSAESDGVKAAAKNLGKAFGFDLKNKLNKDVLPPSIAHFAEMLNRNEAARRETPATIEHQPGTVTEAAAETRQEPAAAEPAAAKPAAAKAEPVKAAEPAKPVEEQAKPKPEPETVAAAASKPADAAPVADKPAADAPTAEKPVDAAPAAETAAQSGDAAPKPETADWEMSIRPVKFEEWLSCIQTMGRRLNAMTSSREIDNFIRRNAQLIKALPILPAEGDRTAKDFRARWKKIVQQRYEALGAPIPPAYRDEQVAENA